MTNQGSHGDTTGTTAASKASAPGMRHYTGGCHCGAVRFEVDLDLSAGSGRCNCSICAKMGVWGAIVRPEAFTLISGEESLTDYQFNTRSVHHLFCKVCGIRAFERGNIPQIGGEYRTVNLNCLDDADLTNVPVKYFDGKNNNWG